MDVLYSYLIRKKNINSQEIDKIELETAQNRIHMYRWIGWMEGGSKGTILIRILRKLWKRNK